MASAAPVVTASATAVASAAPIVAECKEPAGPRPTVVDLSRPWPEQDWQSGSSDTTPAVVKACSQFDARRATLVKKTPRVDAARMKDIGRCFPSPKGAWALNAMDARVLTKSDTHPEEGWAMQFALTYVPQKGKAVRSKKIVAEASAQGDEQNEWSVLAVFDFDGDGISEIVIGHLHHYGDRDRSNDTQVLTFKDGDIVPYGPTAALKLDRVLDIDGDKRPDFIVAGASGMDSSCSADGGHFNGPQLVAHGLGDGGFALDDAVVKEAVRAQCGPDAVEPYVLGTQGTGVFIDGSTTVWKLACSRIYGVAPGELARRLRAGYPFPTNADDSQPDDSPGKCLPLKSLIDFSAAKGAFTVEPPCAAK